MFNRTSRQKLQRGQDRYPIGPGCVGCEGSARTIGHADWTASDVARRRWRATVRHVAWLAVVGVAAAVLAAGCATPSSPPSPDVAAAQGPPRFEDAAAAVGLTHRGQTYGPAAADFDGDGMVDLAISNHGRVVVWRGGPEGFQLVGKTSQADTHGISWLPGPDGDEIELYVVVGAQRGFGEGANEIWRASASAGLVRRSGLAEPLADPRGRGRCAVPIDLTGDGNLELAILNAPQPGRPPRLVTAWSAVVEDRAPAVGLDRIEAECVTWAHVDDRPQPLLVAYGDGRDSGRFFRANDHGVLTDVTAAWGFEPSDWGIQAATFADFDGDGDLDLYLVHGFGVPPEVRTMPGSIAFRCITSATDRIGGLRFRTQSAIDLDVVIGTFHDPQRIWLGAGGAVPKGVPIHLEPDDPRLRGKPELGEQAPAGIHVWSEDGVTTVLFVGDGRRFRAASGRITGAADLELVERLRPDRRPSPPPNTLLENREGRFVDVTEASGAGVASSGRDALFADVDNDGDLDLWLVNGGTAFENLPDNLLLNLGDGRFTDVTAMAGVAAPAAGRGSAGVVFDIDGDLDLDLIATNGDGPPLGNDGPYSVWRNLGPGGEAASLELVGLAPNSLAFGARVYVTVVGSGRTLALERAATTGRFTTSVVPFHIGLGTAGGAKVRVVWPSGATTALQVRSGDRLRLEEPGG